MSNNSITPFVVASEIHAGFRAAQEPERYAALHALSSAALASLAFDTKDDDAYKDLIACLHQRGSQTEFKIAADLSASEEAQARKIGADILGQLGWNRQAFQLESLAILRQLLSDSDVEVITAAVYALGHRNDPQALADLLKLVAHPSHLVRAALANGLSGHEDEAAIAALIVLSADTDEATRDWATFALASLCETRSESLTAALIARLDEANAEIRGEALLGLAKRGHPEALPWLIRELNSEVLNNLVLEAAEYCFTDRQAAVLLRPLLLEWKAEDEDDADDYFERCLDRTLAACERAIAA